MRHRAASQTQRTRRLLSQEALKRSHRRCELIRLIPEDEPKTSPPCSVDEAEQTKQLAMILPLS